MQIAIARLHSGSHSDEREDAQLKKSVQDANFHVANVDKLGRVIVEGNGQETGGDGARAGAARRAFAAGRHFTADDQIERTRRAVWSAVALVLRSQTASSPPVFNDDVIGRDYYCDNYIEDTEVYLMHA